MDTTMVYTHTQAEIRQLLIRAIQRAWRRHQLIVPLYRQLAAQAPDEARELLLLRLADYERAHQQRYARMLARLHAPVPQDRSPLDRLWLWLLLHCGAPVALHWIAWIERRDLREITTLMLAKLIRRRLETRLC